MQNANALLDIYQSRGGVSPDSCTGRARRTSAHELISLPACKSVRRIGCFCAYHSGSAEADHERVIVIGPEKLAKMAVDAVLAAWLIRKALLACRAGTRYYTHR